MGWGDDAGEGRNFFSREKKFRPSPAPPSHFKKSGVLWRVFFLCLLEKRCTFSGMLFVCGIADDVAAKLKKLLLRGIL